MENNFDVVIIGAGPAGLSCADALKGSNLKILLIEKNEVIGPKVCGGGLTYLDKDFGIPDQYTRLFVEQVVFINGKKIKVNLNNPLRTISRYDLGQFMLSKIENSNNITIFKSTSVKEIKDNQIITSQGTFSYRFLVGADGSNSLVRRFLNLPSRIYIGMQYILPRRIDEIVWFLEPKLLRSGYGWIFPHKDFTSIGVFFNPQKVISIKAKEALEYFLKKSDIDYSDAKFESAPVNCLFKGLKFGNIYLAGDAAGLTSRTTGEGIAYAITSGMEIGQLILGSIQKPKHTNRIMRYKKTQEVILDIFDYFPILQNLFFRIFVYLFRFSFFQKLFGN